MLRLNRHQHTLIPASVRAAPPIRRRLSSLTSPPRQGGAGAARRRWRADMGV